MKEYSMGELVKLAYIVNFCLIEYGGDNEFIDNLIDDEEKMSEFIASAITASESVLEEKETRHFGDCTKQPVTCMRCFYEEHLSIAEKVAEKLRQRTESGNEQKKPS